jgi:lycopene beta-cyclase
MDRYQYVLLMGACVVVTLPLEFFAGARVWRQPRRLVLSLLPALALFVTWDVLASATLGVQLPGGMAVEELAFFTVIPICALLTLETVRRVVRRSRVQD